VRPLLPITSGTHRPTRSRRPVSSKQVLPEDAKTPDAWVQRHPSLIRLTGKHPFNVEAPPAEIYDYGFISPVNLHIVRNHGAVPKLDWDTHRIEISGNVPNPYSIGMDELTQMPSDCFPCLVVCAGNRRSGSTWQFHAVKLILQLANPGRELATGNSWKTPSEDPAARALMRQPYAVLKTHEYHEEYEQQATHIVVCHRDPRDVMHSVQRIGMEWEAVSFSFHGG